MLWINFRNLMYKKKQMPGNDTQYAFFNTKDFF